VQGALIFLFRWVFGFVANFLNDFENWRTEAQYQDALITKTYGYGFVNNFFPILFMAFIANSVQPFGADVSCGNECTDYVVILVGVFYLQNAIVNVVITMFFSGTTAPKSTDESENDEVGKFRFRSRALSRKDTPPHPPHLPPAVVTSHHLIRPDIIRGYPELSPAEIEGKLSQFGGLTEAYLDKMMELGYIMMFAAACPVRDHFLARDVSLPLASSLPPFLRWFVRESCRPPCLSCTGMLVVTNYNVKRTSTCPHPPPTRRLALGLVLVLPCRLVLVKGVLLLVLACWCMQVSLHGRVCVCVCVCMVCV
jgi:hypothetical protein